MKLASFAWIVLCSPDISYWNNQINCGKVLRIGYYYYTQIKVWWFGEEVLYFEENAFVLNNQKSTNACAESVSVYETNCALVFNLFYRLFYFLTSISQNKLFVQRLVMCAPKTTIANILSSQNCIDE